MISTSQTIFNPGSRTQKTEVKWKTQIVYSREVSCFSWIVSNTGDQCEMWPCGKTAEILTIVVFVVFVLLSCVLLQKLKLCCAVAKIPSSMTFRILPRCFVSPDHGRPVEKFAQASNHSENIHRIHRRHPIILRIYTEYIYIYAI